MKIFRLCLLFLFISIASKAQENTEKIKDIKKFLSINGSTENAKIGIENMINLYKKSPVYSSVPTELWDDFLKEIDYQELSDLYIPIYDEHFSHEDIKAFIAFYESPAGKKMVQESSSIMTESMAAGAIWGQKIGLKVASKFQKN